MAIYPDVDTKLLGGYNTRLARIDGLIVHIAVSDSHFPSYQPGTAAHFYGRKDGSVGQQVDSRMRGGSSLQGNPFYHAMENQGGVGGDIRAGWTEPQMNAIARIARLSSEEGGWPLRLMANSNDRGLGYHRLGVDGAFPSSGLLAGRIQRGGGRKFSNVYGKTCPTDPRILQLPIILEIARGSSAIPVSNPVTPAGPRTLYLASPYMHGEDVADWQRTLNALGFTVKVDAWFGPGTDVATKAFQHVAGLREDGDAGPATRIAAIQRLAPPPVAPVARQRNQAQSAATQRAVHVAPDTFWGDDTDNAVNLVRNAINGQFPQGVAAAQRVVGAVPDNVWGPKSRSALAETIGDLQAAWGTSPDRIWGANTEAAWQAARAANYKVW